MNSHFSSNLQKAHSLIASSDNSCTCQKARLQETEEVVGINPTYKRKKRKTMHTLSSQRQ
jgi:hypothetical protein